MSNNTADHLHCFCYFSTTFTTTATTTTTPNITTNSTITTSHFVQKPTTAPKEEAMSPLPRWFGPGKV